MIKHLFMAGLLTVGASAAYAQQATTPPRAADPQVAAMPSGADAKKLIGRNVKNRRTTPSARSNWSTSTPTARSTA